MHGYRLGHCEGVLGRRTALPCVDEVAAVLPRSKRVVAGAVRRAGARERVAG